MKLLSELQNFAASGRGIQGWRLQQISSVEHAIMSATLSPN